MASRPPRPAGTQSARWASGIELNLVAAYIRDAEEHACLMPGEVERSIQAQTLAHARVFEQRRGGKVVRKLDDPFGINEY